MRKIFFALVWLLNACQSINSQKTVSFSDLPTKARLSQPPWSSDSWAHARGGISLRWQQARIADEEEIDELRPYFDYRPGDIAQQSIAMLSPIEKLDLFRGDSRWSSTLAERQRTQALSQTDEDKNLGQAWAQAAIQFEPVQKVNLQAKNGTVIPFAADDVYALLTWELSQRPSSSKILAMRCPDKLDPKLDKITLHQQAEKLGCPSLSPALFHRVLAERLGQHDEGVIIARMQEGVLISEPVAAFESRVLGEGPPAPDSAKETHRVLRIKTVLFYTAETPVYSFDEDKSYPYETENYAYELDLDKDDKILGGRWYEGSKQGLPDERPELLWTSTHIKLSPELQRIYEAAREAFVEEKMPLPDPFIHLPSYKQENIERFFAMSFDEEGSALRARKD